MKVLMLSVLALFSYRAYGNDSIAGFANGEIVLTKSDQIRMESEELEIGVNKIKVSYSFYNESNAPITTEVAFPMPAVTMFAMENESSITGFLVNVDGKAISPTNIVKLFSDCKRSEKQLKSIKDDLLREIMGKGKSIAKSELAALKKRLLPIEDDISDDQQCLKMQEIYHWQQVFPIGRLLSNHEYIPSTSIYFGDKDKISANKSEFCIDKGTSNAILKIHRSSENINYQTIKYVLKTGSNWNGPVKSFKLKIIKPKADSVLSVCFDGIKKVSELVFEAEKKNFMPKQDLNILFVSKYLNL